MSTPKYSVGQIVKVKEYDYDGSVAIMPNTIERVDTQVRYYTDRGVGKGEGGITEDKIIGLVGGRKTRGRKQRKQKKRKTHRR